MPTRQIESTVANRARLSSASFGKEDMAILYNLGVDCGTSDSVACAVASHFSEFTIHIAGLDDVSCEIWEKENHGHHFVGVWPCGLGFRVANFCRPELMPHRQEIEDAILTRLATLTGFRRAMYCAEAYDTLWFGEAEELDDIDYGGMIYSEADFSTPPKGCVVENFSPGYSIVKERIAEQHVGAYRSGTPESST